MNVKEKLYAPFQNIQSRKGRGGVYEYVSWKDVANRMNDIFGTDWSSEVKSQEVIGNNIVVRVRVLVTDVSTGVIQYQEGFGGAQNDERAEAGNVFKAAYSKALKDACKKWGIGLYFEETTDGANNTPLPRTPSPMHMEKETITPSPTLMASVAQPVSPIPTAPPIVEVPTFPVDKLAMADKFPEPNPIAPIPGNCPTPVAGGMPLPPGIAMNMSSGTVITQEQPEAAITSEPATVSTPPATSATIPLPPAINLNTNGKTIATQTPTVNMGEPENISDVQKAALHSILSIKGVKYETLATEAFAANGVTKTPVPSPDALTYQEAVFIVKYGNDKFRRR